MIPPNLPTGIHRAQYRGSLAPERYGRFHHFPQPKCHFEGKIQGRETRHLDLEEHITPQRIHGGLRHDARILGDGSDEQLFSDMERHKIAPSKMSLSGKIMHRSSDVDVLVWEYFWSMIGRVRKEILALDTHRKHLREPDTRAGTEETLSETSDALCD